MINLEQYKETDTKDIDRRIENILEIMKGGTFYSLPLLKANFQSKIERLINNKKLSTAEYAVNKCKEHKIFTERNKIFKLYEDMKNKASTPQEEKSNREYEINNIKVLENYEIDRLQIFFDGKPDQETITKLKKNGWRWSPFYKAWQRQLTSNARHSAHYVLGESQ